jgi:tetratricopeptide (TPR) repeat protein
MFDYDILRCGRRRARSTGLAVLLTMASAQIVQAQLLLVKASAGFDQVTDCPTLTVTFAEPLEFLMQSASRDGSQIDLVLRAVGDDNSLEPVEPASVPVPATDISGATDISLTQSGADLVLRLTFAKQVFTDAALSSDGSLLAISIADAAGSSMCLANLTRDGSDADFGDAGPPPASSSQDQRSDPEEDNEAAATSSDGASDNPAGTEADFIAARAAITAEDYRRAIQLLTSILSAPENDRSAEAQELLGVVRERNGQLAHAQAEYEIYLEKYPDGQGAVRVRQRLDALTTAQDTPPEPLRDIAEAVSAGSDLEIAQENIADDPSTLDQEPSQQEPADFAQNSPSGFSEVDDTEGETTLPNLSYSGSLDATYNFHQVTTRFSEFDTVRTSVDDFVLQNSLVTSLSFEGAYETKNYLTSWRIAGAYEVDFEEGSKGSFRFSRLYIDHDPKRSDLSFRFGRHLTRSGGVFDRLDGLTVSWQPQEDFSAHFQIGSAVDSVRDPLFQFDRLTYGVSADFTDVFPDTDLAVYATEQRVGSLIDRRSIGFGLEYDGENLYANAALDYDPYFGQINYARVSGTRIFGDQSTLTLSFDYVQSPSLAISNAEQGQAGRTLDDLRELFTLNDLKRIAIDRTTTSTSATLAYYRPFNDTWLFNMDATIFKTQGNPLSAGVPEIEAPGTDYYASLGVFGSGVFSESDVVSASVRYANTSSSTLNIIDASYRFEPTDKLRLRPRLRLGHRNVIRTGGTENFAIPSITAAYKIRDDMRIELEIGGRVSKTRTPATSDTSIESFASFGVRYDF